MGIIAGLLSQILFLLIILFFARAIMSWLLVFGVRNQVVLRINVALASMTEPIIAPIRRYVPTLGGLDLSYMVAVLLLVFIRTILQGLK